MSDKKASPIVPTNPVMLLARQALGLKPLVISPKRKYLALLLAGIVDVVQFALLAPSTGAGAMSPLEWGVDIGTTILLVAILGWNWRLLAAFVFELIPAVALFPTWSALILTITALAPNDEKAGAPAPYGGGTDPLHLTGHIDGPTRDVPHGAVVSPGIAGGAAIFAARSMEGWYRELLHRVDLHELDCDSSGVEVIVEPVGSLGVFRRSPVTALWYSCGHGVHLAGN